jgi:hypothetical protein
MMMMMSVCLSVRACVCVCVCMRALRMCTRLRVRVCTRIPTRGAGGRAGVPRTWTSKIASTCGVLARCLFSASIPDADNAYVASSRSTSGVGSARKPRPSQHNRHNRDGHVVSRADADARGEPPTSLPRSDDALVIITFVLLVSPLCLSCDPFLPPMSAGPPPGDVDPIESLRRVGVVDRDEETSPCQRAPPEDMLWASLSLSTTGAGQLPPRLPRRCISLHHNSFTSSSSSSHCGRFTNPHREQMSVQSPKQRV